MYLQALCYFASVVYQAGKKTTTTTHNRGWFQLWFSPAASRSVISDPDIATKKSHSGVRENQLQDRRRKLQRFQNSAAPAALRGLPLVGVARHGKAEPAWDGAWPGGGEHAGG